jgi:hypothetical protein
MEKGYVISVSLKLRNSERTVLANIDKKLAEWIDQQVQTGKYRDKSH